MFFISVAFQYFLLKFWIQENKCQVSFITIYSEYNARIDVKHGGRGVGIGRAFETIFRPLGWAFDDTGLPGGGGAV